MLLVGPFSPRASEVRRKAWFAMSATEWAASANIAAEPVNSPAAPFAIAIEAFAAKATSTVLRSALT
jgi:hypothetical protein